MYDHTLLITGVNTAINTGNNQFSKVVTMMGFNENPGFRKPYEFEGQYWEPTLIDRYTFSSECCHGGTTPIHYYAFLN